MNLGGGESPMDSFPMLGFAEEAKFNWNDSHTVHFYACRPVPNRPDLAAAVWFSSNAYNVCLYKLRSSESQEVLH